MSQRLRPEAEEMIMTANCERIKAELIDEYTTSIESSTVLAVISDYDLTDPAQKLAAQNALEFLRESTTHDKNHTYSNESSIGCCILEGQASVTDDGISTEGSQNWCTQTDASSSSSTYIHERPKTINIYDSNVIYPLEKNICKTSSSVLDGLNEEDKERAFIAMFPALKAYDITHTLQKCNGNFDKAIDELITQSFLEETGDRCRGINGFASSSKNDTHRRRKAKKKRKKEVLSVVSENLPILPLKSCWDVACENIEFLAKRIGMSKSRINSLYHETGGSLSKTISRILEEEIVEESSIVEDDRILAQILQLHDDFPFVSLSLVGKIYDLTHKNLGHTRDLLQAYTYGDRKQNPSGIRISIRHAPVNLNLEKKFASPLRHNSLDPDPNLRDKKPQMAPVKEGEAANLREARNSAFEKAAVAYRRGRSDKLMNAVATYYAEEGHQYHNQAKKAQSAVADMIAASQCSGNSIDLHGMIVQDAVRIAREYVTTWWHELCERKRAGNDLKRLNENCCYYVVTGSGAHSQDGISKLGPAISKMLIRDGWKIEIGTGIIIVTGLSQSQTKKNGH